MSCEFKVEDIVVLKENQPDGSNYYDNKKNIQFKISRIYGGCGVYLIAGWPLCGKTGVDAYDYRFELVKPKRTKPIKWV